MKTFRAEHIQNLSNAMRLIASAKTKRNLLLDAESVAQDAAVLWAAASERIAKASNELYLASQIEDELKKLPPTLIKLKVLHRIASAAVWIPQEAVCRREDN